MKERSRGLAKAGVMAALAAGCSRDRSAQAIGSTADGSTVASARSGAAIGTTTNGGRRPSWRTEPVFSSPIGAVRLGGTTIVAGVVASAGVLRAVGFRSDGSSWTRDVLTGVGPDPDAEVKLDRADSGDVALVWKGKAAGQSAKLAVLGVAGELRFAPLEIGAESCATADGIAWLQSRPHGVARVAWRSWSGESSRDVASIGADRTPAVVCGDHDVFTLGDGDDDVTAAVFVPNETNARPASVILRRADFDDEELEHRVYTLGDELQIVRLAESGALSIRQVPAPPAHGAWHRVKHRMGQDEDIVAVDGDAAATLVVSTRAQGDDCPNAALPAEQVAALRIDRATGAETAVELAAADCTRSLGPFWIARLGAPSPVVAWIDRRADLVPGAAAVRGLAYAVLGSTRPEIGRLDVDADNMVDAGCDSSGCFVAALVKADPGDTVAPAPLPPAVAPSPVAPTPSAPDAALSPVAPTPSSPAAAPSPRAAAPSPRPALAPPFSIVVLEYL